MSLPLNNLSSWTLSTSFFSQNTVELLLRIICWQQLHIMDQSTAANSWNLLTCRKKYPILIHWAELYPILIHCRTIPHLNTLSRTTPYLNTLTRTIPYLNTLSRTMPYLNTLSRTIPYLNTLQSAANQKRVLRHTSQQPIRIEYYVTRELWATFEDTSRFSARVGSL